MLVDGKLLCAAVIGLSFASLATAEQSRHWHHAGAMPPGAIGRQRLLRGGPLSVACQPVAIRVPQGARIAPAAGTHFLEGQTTQLVVGLNIGPVYRFRVSEIPEHPGMEIFPTVELLDRLYPPPGQALKFPVPIELTADELELAAEGSFVTRVIYLEDPQLAPAIARTGEQQPWVEARPGQDPLVMADHLGRPVAILRFGGRVPTDSVDQAHFIYGAPQPLVYDQPPNGAGETPVRIDPAVQPAIPGSNLRLPTFSQ